MSAYKGTFFGVVDEAGSATCWPQVQKALGFLRGKRIDITIAERKRKRSNSQNAFYWGPFLDVLTAAIRDEGNDYTKDEIHEYLKARFLPKRFLVLKGKPEQTSGSTSRLTTLEFETYLERVRAWAAEMGWVLPLPNEGEIYA